MKLACVVLSREQFKGLQHDLKEFEPGKVPGWWNKFKSNWERDYSEWTEREFKGTSDEELPLKIKDRLDACLEEDALKVFDYAGGGSQRAAFVDGDGYCLKVGFSPNSTYQFKQERKVLEKFGSRECFPQILEFSESCMLCESVVESQDVDWKRMFHVSCYAAVNIMAKMADKEKVDVKDLAEWQHDTMDEAKEFAKQLLYSDEKRWQVMRQMYETIAEMPAITFDIRHADNWGIAKRGTEFVMVCIDVGL